MIRQAGYANFRASLISREYRRPTGKQPGSGLCHRRSSRLGHQVVAEDLYSPRNDPQVILGTEWFASLRHC